MSTLESSNTKREAVGKKILICGAGSIGIFLGMKLYSHGHEVHLFGRRKLRTAGKDVLINNKKFRMPKTLFKMPKNQKYDFIFITSKLYDMEKMVNLIFKNKIKAKIISNIQNGLVDCLKFKKILNKKIIPICVFGGFRIEKNKIFSNPTPMGWKTEFSKEGKEISRLFSSCGIPCDASRKFDSLRVEKMIVNCCLNALSAIEKKPYNRLFSKKETKERINRIFDECYQILSRKYSLEDKEKMKKNLFSNWHNVKHFSSTYQDIVSKRKTEMDFFNGYIIKLAKQYKISAEENLNIFKDFKKIEGDK